MVALVACACVSVVVACATLTAAIGAVCKHSGWHKSQHYSSSDKRQLHCCPSDHGLPKVVIDGFCVYIWVP